MYEYNQIVINSMPRSGSTWAQYLLAKSINRREGNPLDSDINSINTSPIPDGKNFVMRSNNIISLYASYAPIKQMTIIRDPRDIIPSVITKTYGGAGDTVSAGVVIPAEIPKINIDDQIYAQIQIYKGYAAATLENFKNLNVFTFYQVTKDINFFTKVMLGEELALSNEDYGKFLEKAKKEITVHALSHPGYTNAVPEKKPSIYDKIKFVYKLKEHSAVLEKDFKEIEEMYNEITDMCKKFENGFKASKSF